MAKDIVRELLADRRILLLLGLVVFALVLAFVSGIHLGIEFEGGTRIPLTLDKPVDQTVMTEMVDTLRTRVTKFGLSQVNIIGVGDTQIYVEVPRSDTTLVNDIGQIVKQQGQFKGIVDGKVVLGGSDIVPGSIQTAVEQQTSQGVPWQVGFSVNFEAAKKFSSLVKGKANKPLYMFLDKPQDAVILVRSSDLVSISSLSASDALKLAQDALLEENTTTNIYLIDNWQETRQKLLALNASKTKVVIADNAPQDVLADLNSMNFTLDKRTGSDMVVNYNVVGGFPSIDSWPAAGLLSAPALSAGVTDGSISTSYSISGTARGTQTINAADQADQQTRTLKSILSGGALPEKVIVGSTTTVPAPLGAEFLKYSVIGAIAVVLAIVIIISIRYKTAKLILPILLVSFAEIIILVSIIGSQAQIDLSTMAGIIAALGVSVDAQIVVTDELLKKETVEPGAKKRFERAFFIIITNAAVAIVAMVPLFFSSIVEVVGFATSTIMGAVLGVLISRPAYGAIVEKMFND